MQPNLIKINQNCFWMLESKSIKKIDWGNNFVKQTKILFLAFAHLNSFAVSKKYLSNKTLAVLRKISIYTKRFFFQYTNSNEKNPLTAEISWIISTKCISKKTNIVIYTNLYSFI